MPKHKRRKKYVDHDVQGALVVHFARCWLLSVAAAGGLTLLGWVFISPGLHFVGLHAFIAQVLPMALVGVGASLLVLPLLLMHLVRLSNRFAGPVYRLQRHIRDVANGGTPSVLKFRSDDFWLDLPDAYNDLLARLAEAEQTTVATNNSESELLVASEP